MGLIRRKRGYTSWNLSSRGKITEVYVSWDKYDPQHRRHKGGAYKDDWLEEDDVVPASMFGEMKAVGFESLEEEIGALVEIGKMKHCKWARQIAKAMRGEKQR